MVARVMDHERGLGMAIKEEHKGALGDGIVLCLFFFFFKQKITKFNCIHMHRGIVLSLGGGGYKNLCIRWNSIELHTHINEYMLKPVRSG